jgi:hypothetical protein
MTQEGKNYGKLDSFERLEMQDLINQSMALDFLLQKIIQEQKKYNIKREEWFRKVREKHFVPDDVSIRIDDDFYIVESEKKSAAHVE